MKEQTTVTCTCGVKFKVYVSKERRSVYCWGCGQEWVLDGPGKDSGPSLSELSFANLSPPKTFREYWAQRAFLRRANNLVGQQTTLLTSIAASVDARRRVKESGCRLGQAQARVDIEMEQAADKPPKPHVVHLHFGVKADGTYRLTKEELEILLEKEDC